MAHPPRKILVVEDNKDLAYLLNLRFEHLGWTTSVCMDPSVALELLAQAKFDVLFTDHMMPGMTGSQLIEKARAAGTIATLTVIYTGDLTVIENANSVPEDVWVVKKPADMKKLSDDMSLAIESGSMTKVWSNIYE